MKFAPKIKQSPFRKKSHWNASPTNWSRANCYNSLTWIKLTLPNHQFGPLSSRRHSDFALWRVILASIPILPSQVAWQHNKGAEFVASDIFIVIPSWDWMAVDSPCRGSFSSWWIFPLVFLNAALLVKSAWFTYLRFRGKHQCLGQNGLEKGNKSFPKWWVFSWWWIPW